MSQLAEQRCFNHLHREAAARCPGCGRCFCRECVTEHDDRIFCAACLRRDQETRAPRRSRLQSLGALLQFSVGFLAVWMLLYYLGQLLLLLPDSFHEGNLWRELGDQTEGAFRP